MAVVAEKVRRGVYRLSGVTCGDCGGQVFAEWFPPNHDTEIRDGKEVPYTIPASWECYCDECQQCDPNGWPTLRDCRREAPAYWMG